MQALLMENLLLANLRLLQSILSIMLVVIGILVLVIVVSIAKKSIPPTSTLVFKALANGRGVGFEGAYNTLEISAKSISFGDGSVKIDDLFAGWSEE